MQQPFDNISYSLSAHTPSQLPPDTGVEVAFAGRSNAGKSSAINAITGRKGLARTSKTPGRTQAINFFAVDPDRRLVDLPGYGYAKVSHAVKRRWEQTLSHYLQTRQSLRGLVLIMDIRHPLTAMDRDLLQWCRDAGLPVHSLLTKADKLSRGGANVTLLKVRHSLASLHPAASVQHFSSLKHQGIEQARRVVGEWLGDARA